MTIEVLLAYIGPGAGLGSVGALAALVGAAFLIIVGFVWYPAKRIIRRWKTRRAAQRARQAGQEAPAQ